MKKNRLLVVLALATIVLVVVTIFTSKSNNRSIEQIERTYKRPISEEWYQGGTLHKANVKQWKSATQKNKLATCADFMAVADNSISMTELKSRATNLMNCINEATRGLDELNNENVSEMATLCIITLGYR